MIYQIGICDDEVSTCSDLEEFLVKYFRLIGIRVQISIWTNVEDFIRDVPSKIEVDILFLDIEMPGMNGIAAGEYIRNDIKKDAMHIIYISSKTNYAMELFKIHPYDFMVKPIDRDRLIKNVSKLLELDEHDNRYFVYEYNRVKYKIHYADIIYFESERKHIKIICCDGTKKEFVGKIKEVIEILPFSFVPVAQSFVINLRHIKLCKKDFCIMDNEYIISIGRKYKETFNRRIMEYNKCMCGVD